MLCDALLLVSGSFVASLCPEITIVRQLSTRMFCSFLSLTVISLYSMNVDRNYSPSF